jgi:hypothetical protein
MPMLLRFGFLFSALWIFLIGVFAILAVANVVLVSLSVLGQDSTIGQFSLDGQRVTFRDWSQISILFLWFVALGTLSGTITYGFLRHRRWVREEIIACFVFLFLFWVVGTIRGGYSSLTDVVIKFFVVSGLTCFAAWYLYLKKNVEAYFNSLRSLDAKNE